MFNKELAYTGQRVLFLAARKKKGLAVTKAEVKELVDKKREQTIDFSSAAEQRQNRSGNKGQPLAS